MNNPRLLLSFQATSYRPDAYVAAAAAEGIELVLATEQAAAATRFGLPLQQVSFTDPNGPAALCDGLSSPLAGVVAADEASAAFVARVAARLKLPFHSVAGVDAARDKRLQRQCLQRAGVALPRFWLLPAGAAPASLDVTFPCVVKPSMLSGSQGVIRADDAAGLQRAVAVTRAIVRHHGSPLRALSGFDELLIEAYIEGDEVALEGLLSDGELQQLALFDKPDALVGPYFEETLYVTPSRHPPKLQAQVKAMVQRACRALGLLQGPVHAELRLSRQGPRIIEVAARSIGGLCSQVLTRRIGSLERRILRAAAGRGATPLLEQAPAVGVMMVPVPCNGVLRAVHGVEQVVGAPHIDGVSIAIRPGDAVRKLPYGNRYLGFVFAHASDAALVEAALRRAQATLRFDFKRMLPLICG